MTVKAKFKVSTIVDYGNGIKQVNLDAAIAGEENKDWSQWTPSGTLSMQITNPAAHSQFEVGKHYYLTFEADPLEAAKGTEA